MRKNLQKKDISLQGFKGMNFIRQRMSNNYQDRIPVATRDNINEVAESVLNYSERFNDFSNILLNQIGKIKIDYLRFSDPFQSLKKGTLELGDTVENILINLPQAQDFENALNDPDPGKIFKNYIPETDMNFYTRNYRVFYPMSTSDDQWRAAFQSWGSLDNFVNGVFQSMYTASENDLYLTTMELLNSYGEKGYYYYEKVDPVNTKESAENLLTKIREYVTKLSFVSSEYNKSGNLVNVPPQKMVIVLNAKSAANIDVKALAAAFNLPYADFVVRQIKIPDFGDDNNPLMKNCECILMSEDFLQLYDCLERFENIRDPMRLKTNWFAHYWRIFAVCPWQPAVCFYSGDSSITDITITPTSNQSAGTSVQMTAKVEGSGIVPQNVNWSIKEGDTKSTITKNGVLNIGSDQTGTVTVVATSRQDSTKKGEQAITIN